MANMELPEGWSFEPLDHTKTYVLPAGSYYFGDFDDEDEDEDVTPFLVYESTGFADGLYTHKDGSAFLVAQTAFDDGDFEDSHGRGYGIDGGSFVLMSKECFSKEMLERTNTPRFSTSYNMGHILTFPDTISCVFTGCGPEVEQEHGQYKIRWEPTDGNDSGLLTLDSYSNEEDEEEEEDEDVVEPPGINVSKATQTVEVM